jgi:hypothetical protein
MHCTTTLLYIQTREGSKGSGQKNRKSRPKVMGIIVMMEHGKNKKKNTVGICTASKATNLDTAGASSHCEFTHEFHLLIIFKVG